MGLAEGELAQAMFHPRDMAQQRSISPRVEFAVGGVAVVVALALRFWYLDRVALSHFDEGVYASNLWFPSGEGYPARQLYAPPLLPALIELCQGVWGAGTWQPLLPTLAAGCLLPIIVWWVARRWFGHEAGLLALWLAALSPTQTLFARSALTDPPLALAVLLGVAAASEGVARRNTFALWCAGACGALAWWTKWNGWLVLAITGSALPAWLWSRARHRSAPCEAASAVSRETDPGRVAGAEQAVSRAGEPPGGSSHDPDSNTSSGRQAATSASASGDSSPGQPTGSFRGEPAPRLSSPSPPPAPQAPTASGPHSHQQTVGAPEPSPGSTGGQAPASSTASVPRETHGGGSVAAGGSALGETTRGAGAHPVSRETAPAPKSHKAGSTPGRPPDAGGPVSRETNTGRAGGAKTAREGDNSGPAETLSPAISPAGDLPGARLGTVSRETTPPHPAQTGRRQPGRAGSGTRRRTVSRETSGPGGWAPLTRWLGLAMMVGLAWLPCWWDLQRVGGYGPVAANHRSYLVGTNQWLATARQQWEVLQWLDAQLGVLLPAIALGLVAVVCVPVQRRMESRTGWLVWALFASGTAVAGVGVSSVLLTGLWLVDLLRPANRQTRARYESWLLAAWLAGVSLPLWQYRPFPRLTVPWLVATALASGAWFARSLNRSADSLGDSPPALPANQLGVAPDATFSHQHSPAHIVSRELEWDRTPPSASGRSPATGPNLARLVVGAGLLWVVGVGQRLLPVEGQPPRTWLPATPVDQRGVAVAAAEVMQSIRRHQDLPEGGPLDRVVIYVQGEPAVLHHLRRLGVPECRPIQDLSFARQPGPTAAAVYVVSGERSWRQAGSPADRQQARYLQPLARLPVSLPPLAWFDEPPLPGNSDDPPSEPAPDPRLRRYELQLDFHGQEPIASSRPR